MTDNHNYNTPSEGTADWHIPLNDNFERIDTDVEIRDRDHNRSDYEPKSGAKFLATDTGQAYIGDGEQWQRIASTGLDPTFDTVSTGRLNNAVSANAQGHDDLAQNIRDALAELAGDRGRVTINPPDSGNAWLWKQNLTIDPEAYRGVELDFAEGTHVRYDRDGWMLTVESGADGGTNGMPAGATFSLRGGDFHTSDTADPNGGIRLIDAYRCDIAPRNMVGFENSNSNGITLQLKNVDGWSEANRIELRASSTDIGIDFRPASLTGGSGTDSFQDTVIQWTNLDTISEYGVRWRGNFINATINSLTVILSGDGATGHLLDGVMRGMTFQSPEVEHIGTTISDSDITTAFETGPRFSEPPLVLGGSFENVTQVIDRHDSSDKLLQIYNNRGSFRIEDLGRRQLQFDTGSGDLVTTDEDQERVVRIDGNGNVRSGLTQFAAGEPVRFRDHATFVSRSTDPDQSLVPDGQSMVYVSDGSDSVTGDVGDVVLAVNSAGAVKTTVLADFSQL